MDSSAQAQQNTTLTDNTTTPAAVSVKGINNLLDALLSKGLIDNEQYNSLKFEAVNSGKSIEAILKEKALIGDDVIGKTYAEMRGIGFVDLSNIFIPIETLNLIPAEIAKENTAIAFEDLKHKVKVAMDDPLDLQKIKYIESIIGKTVEAFYGAVDQINEIIDTRYGAQIGGEVDKALEEVGDRKGGKTTSLISDIASASTDDQGSAPIIRIVNMILDYGISNKASDIHIEPREDKIAVRFRIRGVLSEKLTIPKKLLSAVVTRIKILSDLKIDEHRIPQDGRFQINNESTNTDIRVSIMPGVFGEKIVMRLLEKSRGIMSLEEIGIRGVSYARMKDALSKTQGIILVTGPTGSGKSQTLASSLKILNSPEVNIITLEDPVEIKIPGVNQTQINPEVGLTFASGLRSILRQDPDIVMVGEIRDAETATLSVQAALVGRLVLSTLHTNSAAGAFIRLIDMGIEPFLLASTVNIVLAQRLVRVLCDECKKAYKPDQNILSKIHEELDVLNGIHIHSDEKNINIHFDRSTTEVTLYHPVGCPKCNNTGYTSRTGIFEALKMSESISGLVMKKTSIKEIQEQAIKEGMLTMIQDGFIKALEGTTTIEEVMRVKNE